MGCGRSWPGISIYLFNRFILEAHSSWFHLFFTCMLVLIATGGSVTTPAPAAQPNGRQQDRARGVRLSCLNGSVAKHKDKKAMGECVGICCHFRTFIWCKHTQNVHRNTRTCYTIRIKRDVDFCSSLKPLSCAILNFAYAQYALSRSSWAPQSLANLICESMGFSPHNHKSTSRQ